MTPPLPLVTAPLRAALPSMKRVILAGCGGGYDVLGAVPLADELRAAGIDVHLASLSFTYLNGLERAEQLPEVPNLYRVNGRSARADAYCPEAWLSRFLSERWRAEVPVWCFEKTGVKPLARAWRFLVERLEADAVVLVDGGIDALLRGDETSLGTPAEDLSSLAAVRGLGVPSALACVGLGSELRDGICHAQVFERMGKLSAKGAFFGTSSVIATQGAGRTYAEAVEFVFANQKEVRRSHVHEVVLAAARGEIGQRGEWTWLSPLSSLFFFFELGAVADEHLFLRDLMETETVWDITARVEAARNAMEVRERSRIPL